MGKLEKTFLRYFCLFACFLFVYLFYNVLNYYFVDITRPETSKTGNVCSIC